MTVPSAILPQWLLEGGRWEYSGYDPNSNLIAYPNTLNGPYDRLRTGFAVATVNVTAGPEAGGGLINAQLLVIGYQNTVWFMQPNVLTGIPFFLYDILTAPGSQYTVVVPM